MKLNERLRNSSTTRPDGFPPARGPARDRSTSPAAGDAATDSGPLWELKARAKDALYARLGSRLFRPDLTEGDLRQLAVDELTAVLGTERLALSVAEQQQLVDDITEDLLGYGPIDRFLEDPEITEVMVNGTQNVYVERGGRIYATGTRFLHEQHLRQVIDRMVSQVGRRIDESSPMVDARLPDGSRINAVVPPLAVDGPALTIRKFSAVPFEVDDLIRVSTLTDRLADLLSLCVRGRLNILVSGGTGTGKTTLLNVLSSFIPVDERIVTIEDSCELRLDQEHVVRLESRPPNIEDRGEVTIRDLVRNALRMRPDRIVVGEVRGPEALDMLQAMNTGHEGSLCTIHANSSRDALSRLETLVLMAGMDLPSRAIREQITSAFDLIVHMTRLRDGSRRVTQLAEVSGMQGGVIALQNLFEFRHGGGLDDDGRMRGEMVATGIRPSFSEALAERGFPIAGTLLAPSEGPDPQTRPGRR